MHAPLVFEPVFMERVWGGRRLQELFGKPLPDGAVIGESWELVDRPDEAESVIAGGEYAGRTIGSLWRSKERETVFAWCGQVCHLAIQRHRLSKLHRIKKRKAPLEALRIATSMYVPLPPTILKAREYK